MSVQLQRRGLTELEVKVSSGVARHDVDSGFTTNIELAGGPAGAKGGDGQDGVDGLDGASSDLQLVAAQDIGGHRAIAVNNAGEAVYADPEGDRSRIMVVGISIGAAVAGEMVTIRPFGSLEEAGWNLTPGFVWLGPNGTLIQSPPEGDSCTVIIGSALSSSRLRIAPQIVARC